MAAHAHAFGWQEVHHSVAQCLLRLRDKADAHQEFDGEGIQLWLDYELEALRYGVDPDLSRGLLSSYRVAGEKLWIITEADRSVTTFLLPEEY